jgi:glycosyltransferase involved in cell wall biosynthesis
MLRVAVVTETYPPEVNGVAATISRFVEGLAQRRHAVQLVRPRQAGVDDAVDDSPLHRAPNDIEEVLVRGLPIPRYSHLNMGLASSQGLRRRWQQQRPDLVHLVTEGPLGWSALRAALSLGIPISSDFRTNFHAYCAHYGLAWMRAPIVSYLRRFHNRCAVTMVPTEALRRELALLGFERLQVVARGVDTDLFHPERRSTALRATWGAGPDTQVMLFVGRLATEKNLQALVAAYRSMHAQRPDSRLVLVGDGPAGEMLRQQCPEAHFAGVRSGLDLAAHYASADVFLFPSVTETYGNVTPEALASGLAVLAFDHAAAAQLIRTGDNGVLARFDDTPSFVRRATELARNREREPAMRQAARETALTQGWSGVVGQLELALQRVALRGRFDAAHAGDELAESACSEIIQPRFVS